MTLAEIDLRLFKRYQLETEFSVRIKDRPYRAVTVDYSLNGVGIFIYGPAPVKAGDILPLDIDRLGVHQKGQVIRAQRSDGGIAAGMLKLGSLKGSLSDYRLPDIFMGLQRTSMSGILTLTRGEATKKVYLKNGDIIFATSTADNDRLGDVLLREGWLKMEQYDMADQVRKKTGQRYATILVELGYIMPRDFKRAVRLQAQRILESTFEPGEAGFEFVEIDPLSEEVIPLSLSATELIYRETKKGVTSQALLEACPQDGVVDFSPNPLHLFQHIRLDRDDKKVIAYVDGETSIMDILRLSTLSEESTLRCLYAMLETQIIVLKKEGDLPLGISYEEVLEMQERRMPHLISERIKDIYNNCDTLGYYGVLGLAKNASAEEIKKAYYKAAKQFHPDLHFSLPGDIKDMLTYIFSFINNAYATLRDERKRQEYNRSLAVKPAHIASGMEMAAARFREGMVLFRQRAFEEAERLFAQARYYDASKVRYHYFHGLSLSELNRHKEAIRALETAIEVDPNDADTHSELGHVFIRMEMPLRSRRHFETALSIDPSNKKAREGLDSLRDDS